MRIGKKLHQDKVVQAFLEAEVFTVRHKNRYHNALKHIKGDIGDDDFLYSPKYDSQRSLVLKAARGWPDTLLFTHFPKRVVWCEVRLDSTDIDKLRYINYSYWNELSKGTRKPSVAAKTIRAGEKVFGQDNAVFMAIAQQVVLGTIFPPLVILLKTDGALAIVEGHNRATGFALAGTIPKEQKFILGTGQENDMWIDEVKD